jgi:hypothetical protein
MHWRSHGPSENIPPLDIGCVIRDAILGSIAGVAIGVSVFILIFVAL